MSYKINSFIASDKDVASYEKRLSICLTPNGFSFSQTDVFDNLLSLGEVECNTKASIAELLTDIKAVFADCSLQTFGMKEVELIAVSEQFVWIPQHLYDADMQKKYLDTVSKVTMGYGVYADYNDLIKSYIVFSADSNCISAFKVAIPGIKIRCQHSKMVSTTVMENSDMQSLLLVNVRKGYSDYALFSNKKLQISNTFRCANFDETMFYALNITKQFHLEDARMTVALCGDVDREKYALLRSCFAATALYTGKPLTLTVAEMQHIHTYRHALILS